MANKKGTDYKPQTNRKQKGLWPAKTEQLPRARTGFVRFCSLYPELNKNVHFAPIYITGNPHKLRDCCMYGNTENVHIIVMKWDKF